jgi:hypothetical protein
MLIKLYGPFNETIGKRRVEFRIEGELTLDEFWRKLVGSFPSLGNYITGNERHELLN